MLRILFILIGLAVLIWLVRLGVEDRTHIAQDLRNGDAVLIEEPDFIENDDAAGIAGEIARESDRDAFNVLQEEAREQSGSEEGTDLEASTAATATATGNATQPVELLEGDPFSVLAEDSLVEDSPILSEDQMSADDVLKENRSVTASVAASVEGIPFETASVRSIVTDMDDTPVALVTLPAVSEAIPAVKKLRIATYNVSLYRNKPGALERSLIGGENAQAKAIATIIQRTRPDVILLNEFDYDQQGLALRRFLLEYLSVEQQGSPAMAYPFAAAFPSNTGIPSGFDLDKSGAIANKPGSRAYGNDAFGYGLYPGQYGFAILSRFPIEAASIRTFRKFKWADMPENIMPQGFYLKEAEAALRLSSKNHVDVTILVGGERIHLIAAHPTPPTFDGEEDRNGRRNHDEIRLLADYVTPGSGEYIVDDAGGRGGLGVGERFVVLGDLNADPVDGAGVIGAIRQLLDSPAVQGARAPASPGGKVASDLQLGMNRLHKLPSSMDTADFNDKGRYAAGNLRLDYVLPSTAGLSYQSGGVFWPLPDSQDFKLIEGDKPLSSDHRLVWLDIELQ